MSTRTPPHPDLPTARRTGGDDGVRALLAWITARFPPPRHTLTDAARALGATTPEQARAVARSIHRAASRTGFDLPTYPAGCARGSVAWKRAMATRGVTTSHRARKRTPAEMDAALAAHESAMAAVAAARSVAAEAKARREEERAKRLEEGRALAEQRRARREEMERARERRRALREWRRAMRAWLRQRPSLPAVVARGTVEQRVASIAARIRAEKALAQWKARRPAEP